MSCIPFWHPLPSEMLVDSEILIYEPFEWGVWREDPYQDEGGSD